MGMGTVTTRARPNILSDFFGNVKESAGSVLNTLTTDVLPNWTLNSLKQQLGDQFKQETFKPENAPIRADQISTSPSPTLWDKYEQKEENYYGGAGKKEDTTGKMLAIGGVILLGILLLVKR